MQVWFSAVTQAFFSLGICFGGLIMYSSYNDFHHNVYRDAMIVTTIDTFTSLLAGCTIFSILGNLMHETGRSDIKDVVQGGTGLAFVSYPDAIAKFDVVPQGGQFILTLVDFYGANFTVFILGAIEIVGVSWIYGLENFCNDLEFMVGRKVSPYWRICWGIITPVLMIVILVYSIASMQPLTYNKLFFPASATGAGWVLFAFGVIQFPIWAFIVMLKRKDESLFEMIKSAFKPSELWRPNNSKIYEDWKAFKEARRRELEQISGFESMWQKFLRIDKTTFPLTDEMDTSAHGDKLIRDRQYIFHVHGFDNDFEYRNIQNNLDIAPDESNSNIKYSIAKQQIDLEILLCNYD
ncbi:hypothetical protein ANN_04252 [Periplaneta americana]|uniref:Sodium-dependent nutrient amino acid transporter 1 n=1 Tax=Periplaneta americana TaxID=6978 RepID=A0ABQ8T821_PERAM|nr:hypothetical protein ANN_04252 [Periplaneta americana]